ncbi:hypothetical protein [Aminipila luticellarii]|uniref:Type II secretion system protein GspF domain-containing protein n=1 Tax=Aminipila luticellarii TaxID=2507160 RepID=A0A410PW71_9FIRM|nr:hypothetical protein [Aminipila luticellarii]QAT43181.1 hypothetical protein EQM06_07965 [Aminipila luticellarii]
MKQIINSLIETGISLVFAAGILVAYKTDFLNFMEKLKMRHRLRERKRQLKEPSALEKHIDCMVKTTLNIKGIYLMVFMAVLYVTVTCVASRNLPIFSAMALAAAVALAPYLILRIRFEGIRRKSSFEGEMLIGNFLNQYRIANFNVYEALEKLLQESKNTRSSNSFVLKMLLELRNAGNQKEIKQASDKFAKVINTNWSRMFAYNIRLAAEKGIDVSVAIEDILVQLRDARVLLEERKRLNSEAIRIVVYMIPLLYVFTVVISLKYIGISMKNYLQNQLFTKEGFLFFTLSSMMFLMNIAIIEIISRQKFDY